MSQTSKALRRLCLATGAVTVVGVLPALAAIPASAATAATLSVAPSVYGATVTSKSTLNYTSAPSAPGTTITIDSLVNGATSTTSSTAANAVGLPGTATDYKVTETISGTSTTVTPISTSPTSGTNYAETLTLATSPDANTPVTVVITGTTNPTGPATDNFSVADSVATAAVTNPVTFVAGQVGAPTLSVSPATASTTTSNGAAATQSSTTTTTFTATDGIPVGQQISLIAHPSTGQQFLPVTNNGPTGGDYTVTDVTTGQTVVPSTTTPTEVSSNPNSVVLTTSVNAVNPGDTVKVVINGTSNPTGTNSSVYLTDYTSYDVAQVNTPVQSFGGSSIATGLPTVGQVNPNTLPANSVGVPFTLTGTNLGTVNGAEPTVTFTPVTGTTTAGAVTVTAYPNTNGTSNGTQYSGKVDNLVGGVTYDVTAGNTYGTSAVSSADQAQAVTGLAFVPESGVRVVDSRTGTANMNIPANSIPAGNTETVSLSAIENAANIPATATAIAMNVTAIGETAPGNFQVFNGANAPGTSTVNFTPGVDTGNFTILPILQGANASNTVSIYNAKGGSAADVTFDVVGYYGGAGFNNVSSRLLDTRPSSNVGGLLGPLPGRQEFAVTVPTTVAQPGDTIALNVTDVAPTAVGNLRVFPDTTNNTVGTNTAPTTPVPNTAVTNYVPGVDSGSFLITKVGADGRIDLYSDSSGTVNVVLDVAGDLGQSSGLTGSVDSITPYRVLDTRNSGGIANGGSVSVQVAGTSASPTDFTPGNAVAAIVSVSAIKPASAGNLRSYPDGGAVPNTATINYYPNNTRENLAIVALKNGKLDLHSDGAFVNSTVDIVGYVLGS